MADVNLWPSAAHALEYLSRADAMSHRTEGEAELLACLPRSFSRVLDLGSGDGRLLALLMLDHPAVAAVALDFSPTMLDRLRKRFAGQSRVEIVSHDMDERLPASLGAFGFSDVDCMWKWRELALLAGRKRPSEHSLTC